MSIAEQIKFSYFKCLIFSFIPLIAFSQEKNENNFSPPQTPEKVIATKAQSKIIIDGSLNENDWQNASIISNFFRVEPVQGGPYKYNTEVRFLYDENNIYVAAICKDSIGKKGIRVQDLRRDFGFGENDVIGIQFDAQNTKQYAVTFQTTPYGNQRDAQIFNDSNIDQDWNALWYVRTSRSEEGYIAEFAIPFKSIRYDKPEIGKTVSWGFTIFRLARRDYEQTVFPSIPQSFSPYRMTYAAKLVNIEAPPPSANIRVEPYTLYQYDQIKENNKITQKTSIPKVGGDVKWAINPNAVLDLTVNTDFAQADVDRAVNNLERFNIFFPERRQFFLENSGIWAGANNFQIRPFFSRSIGLNNNFNATPAPLDVGMRYTNRDQNKTIAALAVRQREIENSGASNFGVARYTQNYGEENNIGAMVTYRLDEAITSGNNQNNNTTISIDGLIRPVSEWTITYLLSTSIDNGISSPGYAGRLFAGTTTNNYYMGYVNAFVSENYAPDMGFVFQNNVMYHSPGGYAILRPKSLTFIRRWDPGVIVDYYHDFENFSNFQQASIYIFPIYTWFKDNSFIEMSLRPTWQNINFEFNPLGLEIENGNYRYTRYLINYNTDQSKKLSVSTSLNFGNFYNGTRNTIEAGIRYAPLPQISLSANYEHNNLNNVGLFQEDLDTNLYTASVRLALNPQLQLSTFYQYNSFDEQGRWNVRFSWEYMPLSFIYLVFNDTQIDAFDLNQNQTQFISKITFLKQF